MIRNVPGVVRDDRATQPIATNLASADASWVIGLGASGGGPSVVAGVLRQFPANARVCVALVQQLPAGFTHAFAGFLRARILLRVVVADEPVPIERGLVVLAPDNRHLVASDHRYLMPSDAGPVLGCRPSMDVLLCSLARQFGSRAAGVVLSGIGSDGVAGLWELRKQGGLTIAQSQASALARGMPQSAEHLDAAASLLEAEVIADTLLEAAGERRRPSFIDRGG